MDRADNSLLTPRSPVLHAVKHDRSRIGLLFDQDYDALAHQRFDHELSTARIGFDLATAQGQWQWTGFDFNRFAESVAARAGAEGWQAVLSHHEFIGALTAALVAERQGLPGTSPESILACQHKYHARRVLQQVAPEANAIFSLVHPTDVKAAEHWTLPCHIKPVRGTFSIMSHRLDSAWDVQRLWPCGPIERWMMRRMLNPFERLCARRLPSAGTAQAFLLEEALSGSQHDLDGWVDHRGVHPLGVVDAIFYPGTDAFRRWQYPSALSRDLHREALEVARKFLQAIGFTRGFFSMEFIVDAHGRVRVLEFNSRLSSQFGDLYRLVDGLDPHRMAISLALGEEVDRIPSSEPVGQVAASLVWRSFPGEPAPADPDAGQLAAFRARFPEATLIAYPRIGRTFARRARWLDSHRYGVINIAASDPQTLREHCIQASSLLGWPPAPYARDEVDALRTPTQETADSSNVAM